MSSAKASSTSHLSLSFSTHHPLYPASPSPLPSRSSPRAGPHHDDDDGHHNVGLASPRHTGHLLASNSRHVALFAAMSLAMLGRGVYGAPDHFILTQIPSIAYARVDPIVNPGGVSGHVHNIMGGSAFAKDLPSAQQIAAADCSSAIVNEDKSNYWSPLLYYRYPNNTLSPMLGQNRIYYYVKGNNVQPFPPGLRMLSGTAMARDTNDTRTLGVMLSCDHGLQTPYLPNSTSNPGGCGSISLGVFFPSCGLASKDLDSADHFSHMTWPTQKIGSIMKPWPNGDVCPPSHPIKYPTIFFEANYYFGNGEQVWRNDPNLLVLSNGDSVGPSYHADFMNGWPTDLLANAIKQCPGSGNFPESCPVFKPIVNKDKGFACRLSSQIPDEEVGLVRPISKLPGCNPLWTADMGPKHPTCDTPPAVPKYVYPNTFFNNLRYSSVIPLALPEAGPNPNSTGIRKAITPSVGSTGASRLGVWGQSGGSNDAKLRVGTYEEIIAGLAAPPAGGNAGISVNPPKAKSVQTNDGTGGGDAMNGTPSHMCKRGKKRSFAPGNVEDQDYVPMPEPPAVHAVNARDVNEDYDELDDEKRDIAAEEALEVLRQHQARKRKNKNH